MSNGLYEAKRPMTVLAGRYGHPLHPMLVPIPIGAWSASLVFDIASHLVAPPAFLARGSEWLIAVGVIGAVAAALAGALDFYLIPTKTRAYRTVSIHLSLNLLVIAAFGADFAWRYASSYHRAEAVPTMQIGLSALCLAALAVSGYLGGKLSYRYGVRVADEQTQAEGFTSGRSTPATVQSPATIAAAAQVPPPPGPRHNAPQTRPDPSAWPGDLWPARPEPELHARYFRNHPPRPPGEFSCPDS